MAEPLKDRIRKLRETLNLTQVEFAELIRSEVPHKRGPHPSTVARWENGSSVPGGEYVDILARVAQKAGVKNLFGSTVAV